MAERRATEGPTTEALQETLQELAALAVENRARLNVVIENQARLLAALDQGDPETLKGAMRQDVKMMEKQLRGGAPL